MIACNKIPECNMEMYSMKFKCCTCFVLVPQLAYLVCILCILLNQDAWTAYNISKLFLDLGGSNSYRIVMDYFTLLVLNYFHNVTVKGRGGGGGGHGVAVGLKPNAKTPKVVKLNC
jgi:hypothetical protein